MLQQLNTSSEFIHIEDITFEFHLSFPYLCVITHFSLCALQPGMLTSDMVQSH